MHCSAFSRSLLYCGYCFHHVVDDWMSFNMIMILSSKVTEQWTSECKLQNSWTLTKSLLFNMNTLQFTQFTVLLLEIKIENSGYFNFRCSPHSLNLRNFNFSCSFLWPYPSKSWVDVWRGRVFFFGSRSPFFWLYVGLSTRGFISVSVKTFCHLLLPFSWLDIAFFRSFLLYFGKVLFIDQRDPLSSNNSNV